MRTIKKCIAIIVTLSLLSALVLGFQAFAAEGIVFEDDFSGDLSNWTEFLSYNGANYAIAKDSKGGFLQLRTNDDVERARRVDLMSTYRGTDYKFDVKIRLNDIALFTYVHFRLDTPDNYYTLKWDRHAKRFSIEKRLNGRDLEMGYSIAGKDFGVQDGIWNNIRIDVKGKNIKIYVNNMKNPAFDFVDNDSPILEGGIGLATFTSQKYNPSVAEFDDVIVYEEGMGSSYEYGGKTVQPDVVGTKLEDKVNLLVNMGLIDDKMEYFSSDTPITRGEFANILMKAMNEKVTVELDKTVYIADDVDFSHPYANGIYFVMNHKIMKGYENKFRPDDYIKYEEMVKTLVFILGYEYMTVSGTYPDAYINVASRIGLLNSVNSQKGYAVTRDVLAQAIYNLLFTEVAQISSLSSEKENYVIDRDVIWINKYFDIYEGEGVINATAYAALDGYKKCPENSVLIGDKVLEVAGFELYYMLGRDVEYTYFDDENTSYLILLEETHHNDVMRAQNDEIIEFNERTKTYITEEDEFTVPLTATVIYNGVRVKANEKIDYTPDYGYVDYNELSTGEKVLNIVSYKSVVVDTIDETKQTINCKFNKETYEFKESFVFGSNTSGNACSFKDIKRGMVLLVAQGNDKSLAKILISTKKIDGELTVKGDDYIAVNDVEYSISPVICNFEMMKAGKNITAYIDYNGNVAAIEASAGSTKFGYLINLHYNQATLDKELLVKVYMAKATSVEIFNCAERVTVDGNVYKSFDDIEKALKNGDKAKQSIVSVKLNSNNEIIEIDFPDTNDTKENAQTAFARIPADDTLLFGRRERSFSNKFYVNTETPIIIVPSDPNEEKDYMTIDVESSLIQAHHDVTIAGYSVGEDKYLADVCVISGGEGGALGDNNYIVVSKVTKATDAEGDSCYRVYYLNYNTGKEEYYDVLQESLSTENEEIIKGLKAGDVLIVNLNTKSQIEAISGFAYKQNPEEINELYPDTYQASLRFVVGTAYDMDSKAICLTKDALSDLEGGAKPTTREIIQPGDAKIYVVDTQRQSISAAKITDVYTYKYYKENASKVAVISECMLPKAIIIYR